MYRILLVEDDKKIQALIVNYFLKKEKNAFEVDVASDGQIGVEKAYENHYDCLLLDVMLPELDGIGLCRKLRENLQTSHIPFVLLTAKTDDASKVVGMDCGADAYIEKKKRN